jgi:hypothetical protein
MRRVALLSSVVLACACGRTELVRYSIEGEGDLAARLPDGGVACTDGTIALQPAQPVVLLVVDRSSSMNQAFPGTGGSKWNALRGALRQQLPSWNDALALGLMFYPSGGGSSCSVSASADVAPTLGAVPQILSLLDARTPGGATPTAPALDQAAATLTGLRTASSAKAVILATDGAPVCNAALDANTCTCVNGGGRCSATRCLDDVRAVDRVTQLFAAGIPTWVVGLRGANDAAFVAVLNRMADAGGRPMSGSDRFFSASSQRELETAFSAIRAQVGACHYLTSSVPDLGGSIELWVDGQFTPYDPRGVEGWQWVDPGNGELKLVGAACTRAQATTPDQLSVVVRCAAP